MATIEERLAYLEYEHAELKNDNAELKKALDMYTVALRTLANNDLKACSDQIKRVLTELGYKPE